MNREWAITKEEFDSFIEWLDKDRDQAAAKYVVIRRRLVTFFNCRGCNDPDSLADETINRIIRKLPSFSPTDEKARIFYGFAKFVYLEQLRIIDPIPLTDFLKLEVHPEMDVDREQLHQCLNRCLQKQPSDRQKMFISYYLVEKGEKVEHHQKLAELSGLTIGGLRKRIFDLKEKLTDCIKKCLKNNDEA